MSLNRICDVCGIYVEGTIHGLAISDDKKRKEFTGCLTCINELYIKIEPIKNLSVDKIMKKLKLEVSE